jgi:antitoxin YefM
MLETLHLLSTPANAARLYEAKADIEAGRYTLRTIPGVNDN